MTQPQRPASALPRLTPATHRGLVAIATMALASLFGCSSSAPPTIRVTDARIVEQTSEGVSMVFVLEGTNTNTEEIPLQRVLYSLVIDGQRVFRGERMAEATLRRRGSQTFFLPVSARWEDLPGPARAEGDERVIGYELRGSLQYIAPGALAEVFFDTGMRRPTLHFSIPGEIVVTDEGVTTR